MRLAATIVLLMLAACSSVGPPTKLSRLTATATTPDAALAAVQADLAKLNGDVAADAKQIGLDAQVLHDALPPPPTNESPDGTQATPGSGTVTDAQGNAWTLAAALTILENAKAAYNGWQSHQLVYHLHKVYVLGLDGNWYSWNGAAFAPDSSPLPPAKASFYVAPTGSDVASGSAQAPFKSLGRCQAAMASSPTIKNCNVSATPPASYYDFTTCSLSLDVVDDGETWTGDAGAVLDGGGSTQTPFVMGPATNVTLTGFKLQNFTGSSLSR